MNLLTWAEGMEKRAKKRRKSAVISGSTGVTPSKGTTTTSTPSSVSKPTVATTTSSSVPTQTSAPPQRKAFLPIASGIYAREAEERARSGQTSQTQPQVQQQVQAQPQQRVQSRPQSVYSGMTNEQLMQGSRKVLPLAQGGENAAWEAEMKRRGLTAQKPAREEESFFETPYDEMRFRRLPPDVQERCLRAARTARWREQHLPKKVTGSGYLSPEQEKEFWNAFHANGNSMKGISKMLSWRRPPGDDGVVPIARNIVNERQAPSQAQNCVGGVCPRNAPPAPAAPPQPAHARVHMLPRDVHEKLHESNKYWDPDNDWTEYGDDYRPISPGSRSRSTVSAPSSAPAAQGGLPPGYNPAHLKANYRDNPYGGGKLPNNYMTEEAIRRFHLPHNACNPRFRRLSNGNLVIDSYEQASPEKMREDARRHSEYLGDLRYMVEHPGRAREYLANKQLVAQRNADAEVALQRRLHAAARTSAGSAAPVAQQQPKVGDTAQAAADTVNAQAENKIDDKTFASYWGSLSPNAQNDLLLQLWAQLPPMQQQLILSVLTSGGSFLNGNAGGLGGNGLDGPAVDSLGL